MIGPYEVTGAGPPLVLSHGAIECSESWTDVAALLAARFTVIVHDARGRGASDRTARFGYRELAEDVTHLADELGIARFFHAGHSMGGRVALEHALEHPERIRGLCVISARAEAPDSAGRESLRSLIDSVRTDGPQAAASMWAKPSDAHYERVRAISARNSVAGTVAALEVLLRMDSLVGRLPELRAPTLLVAGDRDAPGFRSACIMANALPKASLRVLEGVGHFPNLECPDRLVSELVTFLAG